MKLFNEKRKIIILCVVLCFITTILIIAFFNSYLSKYESITENEDFFINSEKENNEIEEIKEEITNEKNMLIIHIAGAVKKEGVIEIEENSRIADAIEKAGGLTKEADLTDVNLAYSVKDGQKIYIPSVKDKEKATIVSSGMGEDEEISSEEKMVNINTATQTQLEELSGIGPSTASSIISYRQEKGKFKSIDEIKNVSGIGEAKYNKIKENICV